MIIKAYLLILKYLEIHYLIIVYHFTSHIFIQYFRSIKI